MSSNFVDVLVIGGGVIGLAIAKNFAAKGHEVIVLEKENTFGSVTSSRNSGVIHAGVYYDKDSMKAKFCADGNRRMYEYCQKFNVPHINTGKFIVATSSNGNLLSTTSLQVANEDSIVDFASSLDCRNASFS